LYVAPPPQVQEEIKKPEILPGIHRRIMLPHDGSENSFKAFLVALELVKTFNAKLVVVHACEAEKCNPDIFDQLKLHITENAPSLAPSIEYKVLRFNPRKSSASSELIKEIVLGGYDLVIMSARGSSLNDELYIGSTAASIIMNTNTSIYIVR